MTRRLLAALVAGLVLVGLVAFLHRDYARHLDEHIERRISNLTSRIDATTRTLAGFSRYVFEGRIERPEITEFMDKAVSAPEDERAVIRARLYAFLKDDYELLVSHDFRQLHFQLPDNRSFLRFHSPNSFGDDLTDIRLTVRLANETKKAVIAFEEGRIYNGYRFVYPLFHGSRHVGSVEVSFSMSSFLSVLKQIEDMDYRFGIRKGVVSHAVFEEERGRYAPSDFSDGYLFDREVVPESGASKVPGSFGARLEDILSSGLDGGYETVVGGAHVLTIVKHIRNVSGEPVACIIQSAEDPVLGHYRKDFLLNCGVFSAGYGAVALVLWMLVRQRARFKRLSATDTLTGLANRSVLIPALERELERLSRYDQRSSVLMLDIDNFKSINDRFGHAQGDAVLASLAGLLSSSVRSTDVVGRWGGEEFLVILSSTDAPSAFQTAEKLRSIVAASCLGSGFPITVSVGVAESRTSDSVDSLIARADYCMYEAKKAGKNRACAEQ